MLKTKIVSLTTRSAALGLAFLALATCLRALVTGTSAQAAEQQPPAGERMDLAAYARAHLEPRFVTEDGTPDIQAIMDHLDDLYRADTSVGRMTLTVVKLRRKRTVTRTLKMKMWSKGGSGKEGRALIVIEAPAREKGTATLKDGKRLLNYLPRIKKTIRIPPSMMLSSWMGSDFTNDDLVRESSLLEDYEAELVGYVTPDGSVLTDGKAAKPTDAKPTDAKPTDAERPAGPEASGDREGVPDTEGPAERRAAGAAKDGREGWLVDLEIKENKVGLWKRIEYVLSPDATLPLSARYYDRKGRLSRVMRFDDVREFPVGPDRDGKPEGGYRKIPARMVLTPVDEKKKGRRTEAIYDEMRFNVEVKEDTFSLLNLERER